MTRPHILYIGFENYPEGPGKIEGVLHQLSRSEAGRVFIAALPDMIRVELSGQEGRASSDPVSDTIRLYISDFANGFEFNTTVTHELAHQLQFVRNLEPDLFGLLEQARAIMQKNRNNKSFAYVSAPIKLVKTEETFAMEVVAAVYRLGYGRNYTRKYHIPGGENQPPAGRLRPSLTGPERSQLSRLIARQRMLKLPTDVLDANMRNYEEFYRRAVEVRWIGPSNSIEASIKSLRKIRRMS